MKHEEKEKAFTDFSCNLRVALVEVVPHGH